MPSPSGTCFVTLTADEKGAGGRAGHAEEQSSTDLFSRHLFVEQKKNIGAFFLFPISRAAALAVGATGHHSVPTPAAVMNVTGLDEIAVPFRGLVLFHFFLSVTNRIFSFAAACDGRCWRSFCAMFLRVHLRRSFFRLDVFCSFHLWSLLLSLLLILLCFRSAFSFFSTFFHIFFIFLPRAGTGNRGGSV